MTSTLSALCVGRHRFLSEHLGRYFDRIGVETRCAVGLEEAMALAAKRSPDVVVCDYDLLVTAPFQQLETNASFSGLPVIAVSLTRRPEEMHLLDINSIGGFFYLPTLDPAAALRQLEMARAAARYSPSGDWRQPATEPRPG